VIQSHPASDEQWNRLRADIGRLVARRVPNVADIEDIIQEVLIRVWRHGSRLRDDERFGAWLSRVAHTAAADHLRSRGRHALFAFDEERPPEVPVPPASATDDGQVMKGLIAAVLRPFVEQLPPHYREVITLSELEGLTHAAIAERLSLSVSGVKSRVQRGREQLKEMLERCCEFALDARGAPVSCQVRPDGILPPGCVVQSNDCGGPARIGCKPAPAGQGPKDVS
jgi:RNA polymerase sigma-70 factor (ECF subfamily)